MKTLQQFLDNLCLWHADLETIDDPISAFCYRCGNDVYEIRRCLGCREIFVIEESQDFVLIADRNLCCHCAEVEVADDDGNDAVVSARRADRLSDRTGQRPVPTKENQPE